MDVPTGSRREGKALRKSPKEHPCKHSPGCDRPPESCERPLASLIGAPIDGLESISVDRGAQPKKRSRRRGLDSEFGKAGPRQRTIRGTSIRPLCPATDSDCPHAPGSGTDRQGPSQPVQRAPQAVPPPPANERLPLRPLAATAPIGQAGNARRLFRGRRDHAGRKRETQQDRTCGN